MGALPIGQARPGRVNRSCTRPLSRALAGKVPQLADLACSQPLEVLGHEEELRMGTSSAGLGIEIPWGERRKSMPLRDDPQTFVEQSREKTWVTASHRRRE